MQDNTYFVIQVQGIHFCKPRADLRVDNLVPCVVSLMQFATFTSEIIGFLCVLVTKELCYAISKWKLSMYKTTTHF